MKISNFVSVYVKTLSFPFFPLQKRAKAQNLLDKVFDHLELIEKDYFGLQFLDLSPDPESMVRDKMVGRS